MLDLFGDSIVTPDISELVGKSFIDFAHIYCFGTGFPISRSELLFQYRHFK